MVCKNDKGRNVQSLVTVSPFDFSCVKKKWMGSVLPSPPAIGVRVKLQSVIASFIVIILLLRRLGYVAAKQDAASRRSDYNVCAIAECWVF